mgnify:CR=1 FL=1
MYVYEWIGDIMIIYYSIYTGCCSVMTIDCFSLYKDIIYENDVLL